MRLITSY